MKVAIIFSLTILICFKTSFAQNISGDPSRSKCDKIIFAYGGQLNKVFLKYIITTTNKAKPYICFLPTASGDNPEYINFWNTLCKQLLIEPHILKTFSASSNLQTFDEQLLKADAIVVGAGNAVNMLAIWKAQGIDAILKKAYDKGIVIAGGSAGSLCWFVNGYTGSRPLQLTKIKGLGFLNFSYCPHYLSDPKRKPKFEQGILNGDILPGYACDDFAGILFINGVFNKAVSQTNNDNNYFVSAVDGQIKEEKLKTSIIK